MCMMNNKYTLLVNGNMGLTVITNVNFNSLILCYSFYYCWLYILLYLLVCPGQGEPRLYIICNKILYKDFEGYLSVI